MQLLNFVRLKKRMLNFMYIFVSQLKKKKQLKFRISQLIYNIITCIKNKLFYTYL